MATPALLTDPALTPYQLNPDMFGKDRAVFAAMLALDHQGSQVHGNNLRQFFSVRGYPDTINEDYIRLLERNPPYGASLEGMITDMIAQYEQVELPRLALEIAKSGLPLDKMQERLRLEVVNFLPRGNFVKSNAELIDAVNTRKAKLITGVRHGFPGFMDLQPEFHYGKTYYLAAKTKDGKSTVARQMALDVAVKQNKRVMFFPLENRDEYTMEAFLSTLAGVPRSKQLHNMRPDEKLAWDKACEQMRVAPIQICDETDINQQIRRILEFRPELIFLDQLSHWTGLESMSRGRLETYLIEDYCKHFSREAVKVVNAACVTLCQVKDEAIAPYRGARVIADSTKITNISDAMLFLYNPNDEHAPNRRCVQIGKRRDGESDLPAVSISFDGQKGVFSAAPR